MFDFEDLRASIEGEEFEEVPVTLEEFVTSPDYLNEPTPSNHQLDLMHASTQIYKRDTLIK